MAERILHYPKQFLNQVDINLGNLRHNYRIMKELAGTKPIMAVIKGDAYGHGLIQCAKALVSEGALHLGVQDVTEGVALRDVGIREQQIYILSGLDYPSQITLAAERDLVVFVYSREQLVNVMNLAQVRTFRIKVFLKIDTGMGRLGMAVRDALPFMQQAQASPYLHVIGLATHLATISDQEAVDQIKAFQTLLEKGEEIFQKPLIGSALSGGAMLAHPEYPDGLSRVGLALYGVPPHKDRLVSPVPWTAEGHVFLEPPLFPPKLTAEPKPAIRPTVKAAQELKPVMRVASTVIQVKRLRKNDPVSYDRTFHAPQDMTIALVPFGYVNGLNTSRSDKNCALIRGQRVDQIGRICMSLTAYDVTHLETCRPGDEVVLLGESEGEVLDAYQEYYQEYANPYEILCLFGRLNRRVHKDD
ncbi:MAG: alanine racemase [Deltaproteobacteria bacterium]|jgi:alanine racemase|nr:alanine racemase [Deltaproteobacteria bacterium]